MKTIDKFILKSYLGPMLASFFIVMFILLMNVLFRYIDDLVGKGLPMSAIAELLFYMTSTMLPIGLPFATLLGAIRAMGNLGSSNELLAMKAAGVSLFRIMRSLIISSILMSILGYFIVNNYVPYSFERTGMILYDIQKQKQEIEFKDGVFFNGIPNISIRVGKQDPKTKLITDVLIYDTRDRNLTKTIVADSGYINLVDNKKNMQIILFNGQNYEDKRNHEWYTKPSLNHHEFDKQEMLMPLEGFSFEKSDNNVFAERSESKSMKELSAIIDSVGVEAETSVIKARDELVRNYIFLNDTLFFRSADSVRAHFKPLKVTAMSIDTLELDAKEKVFSQSLSRIEQMKFNSQMGHTNVKSSSIKLYRAMADWHDKLTLPVSILVFFLIGAPLGAIIRKGGLGMPTVIAVLFFIFYYVISLSSKKLVQDGAWLPAFGMWLPTMVLFPISVFLMWKAITDSKLFNLDAYFIFIDKYWLIAKNKYPIINKLAIKADKIKGKIRKRKIKKQNNNE